MKTAFITGAGSGIGRALAHALVKKGCAVFITDINSENLAAVGEELRLMQANVHERVLDVSDKDDVFRAVDEAIEKLGSVDGMFNNAGISFSDLVDHMDYSDFERVMDIDFWGVVHGTKAVLPGMLERGEGHIVNISSIFGIIGVPSQSAYCAAKHAVKGFNESLYYELLGTGVQLHSVHPGGVDTGIIKHGIHKKNIDGDIDADALAQQFKAQAKSSPDEAAKVILDGVAKSRYRILVGGDARALDRMQRWFPNLFRRLFPKLMAKLMFKPSN